MGRRAYKDDPEKRDVVDRIMRLRASGLSLDGILAALSLEEEVARSTAAKYAKQYDNLEPWQQQYYHPVDWAKLDTYGLPWESAPILLSIWGSYVASNPELPPVGTVVRWWQLHRAAPHLSGWDIIRLDMISRRIEADARANGQPPRMDRIWAWLAFENYRRLDSRGRLAPVDSPPVPEGRYTEEEWRTHWVKWWQESRVEKQQEENKS